jgi:O-antigen ligase
MDDMKPDLEKRGVPWASGWLSIVLSVGMLLLAFASIFFFGVVGKDKALLLAPVLIAGYTLLSLWILGQVLAKKSLSAAPPGFFFMLLFIAYGVGWIHFSPIPFDSKFRMLSIGLFAGSYYMWANSFSLFRRSRVVLGWVLLFMLLLACYGLINFFKNPDWVLWIERATFYPNREVMYPGRLASVFICPNHFAHLLQMLLPFCFVLVFFIPQAKLFLRVLAGYSFVIFLPTLYFSQSRAGMLGSVLALGVTICLVALRKSKRLFFLLVLIVPLLSALLLGGMWKFSEMFRSRMEPVVQFVSELNEKGFENAQINDFRPLTWLDTVDVIKQKPLFGFGPASYRDVFPEYRKRFTGSRVLSIHPHNEYLEMGMEYGLVGLGLFALFWFWGLIRLLVFSLKTPNEHHAFMAMAFLGTAAGTMLHSFFDFQMHVLPNALVFALLAGLAAGPMCGQKQEKSLEQGNAGFLPNWMRFLRFLLLLLALTGLFYSVKVAGSAYLRAKAARQVFHRNPEAAKPLFNQAIKMEKSNWKAYKEIGLLYAKDRYYSLNPAEKQQFGWIERGYFTMFYRYNPFDAQGVAAYGQALIFLGDKKEGIALLREATQLRPFNDLYWWRLGVELRKIGQYEEALKAFERSWSIRHTPSTRANIRWLKKHMKNPAQPNP